MITAILIIIVIILIFGLIIRKLTHTNKVNFNIDGGGVESTYEKFHKNKTVDINQCKTDIVIKKPNGKNVFVFVQGETFIDEGHKIPVDFDKLKVKTLLLLEETNMNFDLVRAINISPDIWTGKWRPRLFEHIFKNYKRVRGCLEWGKYMPPEETYEYIQKQPHIPNNLTVKTTDYQRQLCLNDLFRPYIAGADHNKNIHTSSNYISVLQLKNNNYYNKNKPESYYEELIKQWTWTSPDDFKEKYERFINMNCIDVFNLLMFESMKLHPNVVKFFSRFKYKDYSYHPTAIFNDIPMLNELTNEIESGNNEVIYLYGNLTHCPSYIAYLFETYKCAYYEHPFDKLVNVLYQECKSLERDTTSDEAKLCHEIADEYTYDMRYFQEGILKWKMRSLEELEKNRKLVCHEAAFIALNKLDKKLKPRVICLRNQKALSQAGSNHSIVIFERNNKAYLFESSYGEHYGVIGFKNIDDIIKSFENEGFKAYDITNELRVGMTIYDIDKACNDDHRIKSHS